MDRFLKPNESYYRLWSKYHKHGGLIVAVDFDETLYDSHNSGESYEMIRQLVRDMYEVGFFIIIWTANSDNKFVRSFLIDNGIPFNTINQDAPFVVDRILTRKIHASVFVDDKAGLKCVYEDLTRLLNEIKKPTM